MPWPTAATYVCAGKPQDAEVTGGLPMPLTTPDHMTPLAGLNRALAAPGAVAGTPQAPELRHLRSFVALAEAGSFTHAAEKIIVAQPTLSQQIRRLEEIVGTPLLQRRREGLRLTPPTSTCPGWNRSWMRSLP